MLCSITMSIDGHNVKIIQTLRGHTSDVTCCDFAPNFTLITGSSDKTIRIWEWRPGSGYSERACSPLRGHKYQVTCVRASPQGSMLASASVDGTAVLWSMRTCRALYTMTQVNGDAVRVCRFSPDSAILVTAGDNGAICVWDLVHRSLIKTIFDHEGTTQALAFTPDSQYLVTACSLEVVRVWSVQDLVDTTSDSPCTPLARVDNAQDMGVLSVDISRHVTFDENNPLIRIYKLATSGNTDEIRLWSITTKSFTKVKTDSVSNEVLVQPLDVYDGHTSTVTCVRFSHTGAYLISTSLDKTVKVWDEQGNCVASLQGHDRYVNCAAVSRDSTLLVSGSTGSNDKQVIVWDVTGNLTLDSELNHFRNLAASIEGASENHMAENDDPNGNRVTLLEKMDDIAEGTINSCCFHGRNLLATGSGDKLVRLFKVAEDDSIEEVSFSPLEGHTYAINHVEFSKNGDMLATCSLDGCTIIWNPTNGEKMMSLPKNVLSVKVCRFSPDGRLLVTAGDDEKATVWNVNGMEKITTLDGHLDTIPSACISPDAAVIITVSLNADFRIWSTDDYRCLHVQEDAHDYGVQYCDISPNLEPIPNAVIDDQTYLLATCGNDSLVKLWRITVPKLAGPSSLTCRPWRSLPGHGGNVVCVRFSPAIGEFLCSTATDRQARLWAVHGGECLFVLDHDSIATACCFDAGCRLLATGCLDKSLWLWRLPQQLAFQTAIAGKVQFRTKQVVDWSTSDLIKWLKDVNMEDLSTSVRNVSLDGKKIVTLTEEQICSGLDLDEETTEQLCKELRWLKRGSQRSESFEDHLNDIPHEFLCPITHEIMREPVTCSDGYTYEKNAITEWFMAGKLTSPMTNEALATTDFVGNAQLRHAIREFLET